MIFKHILLHGLGYGFIVTAYLLIMMMTINPRVWGYSDYSEAIKAKIAPQSKREKRLALFVGIPWMIFTFGFPIYSTYFLKASLGGVIPFWLAFVNIFFLVFLATAGDLVILDWLIVSKITPRFVIIEGTEEADYKDFSHHFRGHARAVPALLGVCILFAGIVFFF
ncbi:MAG: hypothetical protein JEZ06_21965 [Anaerolineaceae bacterium]|nr:hypothetical protein [Anaerolineaceae bacterium]